MVIRKMDPFGFYFVYEPSDWLVIKQIENSLSRGGLIFIYKKGANAEWKNKADRIVVFDPNIAEEPLDRVLLRELQKASDSMVYTLVGAEDNNLKAVLKVVERVNSFVRMDNNSLDRFGSAVTKNLLYSLHCSPQAYNYNDLIVAVRESELINYPAIIAGAGPSLTNDLDILREYQGRYVLLAVDNAMVSLLLAGIEYHLGATIDPNKPMKTFSHERIKKLPMICTDYCTKGFAQNHVGDKYYLAGLSEPIYESMGIHSVKKPEFVGKAGNTVTNLLVDFVIQSGFKTVIFTGVDLAYPGNKVHARKDLGLVSDEEHLKKMKMYQVEDNEGNLVDASIDFVMAREAIETDIASCKDNIRFINTSLKGAKIKGTMATPMERALKENCLNMGRTFSLPIVKKMLTPEEKKLLNLWFDELPEMLNNLKNEIYVLRGEYEHLYEELHAGNKELGHIVEIIGAHQEHIDQSPLLDMIIRYTLPEERLQMNVYDSGNEIWDVIAFGISCCDAYMNGIDRMKAEL